MFNLAGEIRQILFSFENSVNGIPCAAKINGFHSGVKDFMLFTLRNAREYLEAGEFLLSFESLCDNLYEIDYPLTKHEIQSLFQIAEIMKLEKERYLFINELGSKISPEEKYSQKSYLS
ncbi:MafI family immunity protein [Teredinibacter turnerae]|uniref:MafI family immunity protein n=1 Tax=Teredinibacter turnerae TaxID=2426 RepID=UPI0005F7AFE6|nr:MafI family immunity protein [Teredinibacter turnerae]